MNLSRPSPPSVRVVLIALAALTVAVYSNSLFNKFTIDDEFVYSDNQFVRHLSNLPHLFDHDYFRYSNEASYRPVCTLTYFLDAALWPSWSGGPHLTNLVLYTGTVLLLFQFFRRLTGNEWAAIFAAVLFAVHPIHTEVVDNISFREDLLIGLLLPASWLLYKRSEQNRPWLWMPLAWLCYFVATLSKEMAVMFSVLAVVLELTEQDARVKSLLQPRRLVFLVGLMLCTILFVLIRFHWMRFAGETHVPRLGGSIVNTILATPKIQAQYLLKFVCPYPLRALYPSAMYSPALDTAFLVSLAALLVLAAFVIYFHRERFFMFAVLWWFLSLAPVSNLYPIFNPMAERYLFLPSIGACLWIGWLVALGLQDARRTILVGAASVLGLMLAAVTFTRNPVWHDNLKLWNTTAEDNPASARIFANLAAAYYQVGNYEHAIARAEESLKLQATANDISLNPAALYLCIGNSYWMKRQPDLALENLRQAESYLPARFDIDFAVLFGLGMVYDDQRNDLKTAFNYYHKAAAIDPFRVALWRRISFCKLRLGDRPQAEEDWRQARSLDPGVMTFEEMEKIYKNAQQVKP